MWKPDDHQSFFSGAEGWGTYRQLRKGRSQLYEVRLSFGQIRVKVLRLDPTGKRGDPVVRVTLDQNRLVADCQARDGALVITFPEEVILRAGQSLEPRRRELRDFGRTLLDQLDERLDRHVRRVRRRVLERIRARFRRRRP